MSTTVSAQWESAGSSPAVSASRLHAQSHDLITRVKSYVSEKTWVFPPPPPKFHWFLSFVQHSTKAYYVIQNKV